MEYLSKIYHKLTISEALLKLWRQWTDDVTKWSRRQLTFAMFSGEKEYIAFDAHLIETVFNQKSQKSVRKVISFEKKLRNKSNIVIVFL